MAVDLASHGYIVVSISANGINAKDNLVSDVGARARAELIHEHLRNWAYWSTSGGFPDPTNPNLFVGKVNMQRVGTMGHSRGGEGVVRHISYNIERGAPFGITGVLPLAPIDSQRLSINGVPFGVILPYCDGDVVDLQGVHYFDDGRYDFPPFDPTPRHMFLMMKTNHNYFNTIWSPSGKVPGYADDWLYRDKVGADSECKPTARLSEADQRAAGRTYINAFMRTYASSRWESAQYQFYQILTGDAPPPASAPNATVYISHNPGSGLDLRKDLNRLETGTELVTNTLGGQVTFPQISPYRLCGGANPQPEHCLDPNVYGNFRWAQEPHTAHNDIISRVDLSQLDMGWSASTASYKNQIPAAQANVSTFETLQFRVGVDFSDSRNPVGVDQNFSIWLRDRRGQSASVFVASVYQYPRPNPLYYPPGSGPHAGGAPTIAVPVPRAILNTVRLPLSRFTAINGSLDLTNIESVEFKFNSLRNTGGLLFSDIAFTNSLCPNPAFPTPVPCSNVNYRVSEALATVTVVPGTTEVLTDCGDCTTTVTLPFPYTFYDQTFSSVIVGDNGTLGFGPNSNTNPPNNADLPSSAFNYAILPYWDNLYLFNGNGIDEIGCPPNARCGIYTLTTGQAPNRIFNIEWRACQSSRPPGTPIPPDGQFPCGFEGTNRVIFEVRLHEGRKQFDLVYDPTANGSSMTIGAQRGTAQYVQYSINSQIRPGLSQLTFTQQPCAISCATQFQDVQSANTFNPYVHCLTCRGIITGYGCGGSSEPCVCPTKNPYFRPNNVVTRGQASKMVAKSVGFNENISGQTFQDVLPSNTFYKEIEQLARRGYVTGYPCGGPGEPCVNNRPYFRPSAEVTRGQLAKIVSNSANFFEGVSGQRFSDVPSSNVFYLFIERLANRNVMTGYSDGTFRPFNNATRGQTSKIVANSFFPGCENVPIGPIPTPDGSPEGPEIPTPPPTMPAPIETQEPVLP